MTQNRFIGRNQLRRGIARCATEVERRLVLADSGLLVIFEDRPIEWQGLHRVEPFYVARHDLERDGPERGTPEEVLARLRDPLWQHFVWIPFEVARADESRFTIRYAHELQHYRQLSPGSLEPVRDFLRTLRRQGFVPTIRTESDPAEFDADRMSLSVFREIHGPERLSLYVQNESTDPLMANLYVRLLSLEAQWGEYVARRV